MKGATTQKAWTLLPQRLGMNVRICGRDCCLQPNILYLPFLLVTEITILEISGNVPGEEATFSISTLQLEVISASRLLSGTHEKTFMEEAQSHHMSLSVLTPLSFCFCLNYAFDVWK